MPKIVNTALKAKAKAKAKAWTFEAKAKATGPEAKAKAKAVKFGLEAPRGQGLASRTTSLPASKSLSDHRITTQWTTYEHTVVTH